MEKHPYYQAENPEKEINVRKLIFVALTFLVVVIAIIEIIK